MPLNSRRADARASGQGVHRRRAADDGWLPMGTIVKFPDEGRVVRFGCADNPDQSATVIILPVIRIERHGDPGADEAGPRTHPPADSGGSRRVRRR